MRTKFFKKYIKFQQVEELEHSTSDQIVLIKIKLQKFLGYSEILKKFGQNFSL